MAAGLYNELTQSGELLRKNLVAPIETRINVENMKEARAARQKATAEADVKKEHRATAAEAIPGIFKEPGEGQFAKEAYLGGEPLQSISAAYRMRHPQTKATKAGKNEEWSNKVTILSGLMDQATEQLGKVGDELLNASQEEKPKIQEKFNSLSKATEQMKIMVSSLDKDLQDSTVTGLAGKLSKLTSVMTPDNISSSKSIVEEVMKKNYGIDSSVMDALKDTKEVFGVDIQPAQEHYTENDIAKMYLAVQSVGLGTKGGNAKLARDEAKTILEMKSSKELSDVANNTEIPMKARVFASALLKNMEMFDSLEKSAVEKLSTQESDVVSGKPEKTQFQRRVKRKALNVLRKNRRLKISKEKQAESDLGGTY